MSMNEENAMVPNRAKRLLEEGRPSFGTYVTFPTAAAVETAAVAGFDFVRLDAYHATYNNETLADMVRTAYGYGVTPWVRVRNDPWTIMTTLDLGVQIITIPNVGTADAARAAVEAARYPPDGTREMSRPLRFRGVSAPEYIEWTREHVLVAGQIEGPEGIENYSEIVGVSGLDIVQTGRGDLSLALGVPGDEFHPDVLATEQRIVDAALRAGKDVALKVPLNQDGLEQARRMIDSGVRMITIDSDYAVLLREYGSALKNLRRSLS